MTLLRAFIFTVSLFACSLSELYAQDTAAVLFREVQITGFKGERKVTTSLDIATMTHEQMVASGAFNVSDGLSRIPGVSQLSTGLAISKPVIRGLYGNRVLTLLSGLRFDNQQWQDEHGLGISDMGIDRVEVIKGPLAILYGTDAVGGVLNIIEETKAPEGKINVDYNFRFNSNTLGGSTDVGVKGNNGNYWWRVRSGGDANPDYSDGAGIRVLNSRFNGVYFKASFGAVTKRGWTTENNYNFSRNNFGFVFADLYSFLAPDSRYSLALTNPHHTVMFNVLSSQNTKVLHKGLLKLNAGFQSNQRQEDEGGGKISINMLLSTAQYNLQWVRPLSKGIDMIISHATTFENNTNFGFRKIIPDAYMLESLASAFFKFKVRSVIFEAGAGIDDKWIKTLETKTVNTPDRPIQPFSQNRHAANGILGLTWNVNSNWNIKVSAASGLRAPNLAELSANGLHEGTFSYELGDPRLKNEQNINTDLTVSYGSRYFQVIGSAFYNHFFHYIYLQKTDSTVNAFALYLYKQQEAFITGGEISYKITPQGKVRGLEWSQSFSGLLGRTADKNYLPFIAPPKLSSALYYSRRVNDRVSRLYGSLGFDYVFEQGNLAPLETYTRAYKLLNASIGIDIRVSHGSVRLSIIGNNLLGEEYYDHLSRIKNIDLAGQHISVRNIGRNLILQLNVPLTIGNNKKH